MKFIKRILQKYRSWRLRKKIAAGRAARGRTGPPLSKKMSNLPKALFLQEGKVEMQGSLSARVIRESGLIEDLGIICTRVVTTVFVNYLVDALQNSTTHPLDVFKYHDAGTGTTAEAVGDTAMETAWGGARVTGTQIEGASANIFKTVATITLDNTFAITEHGLFSAASAGTLKDRSVFSAINVSADDSIEFTYELTVTAGG